MKSKTSEVSGGRSRIGLLITALGSLLCCPPSPAYASLPGDTPQQQVLTQQKKIDETIVQPCKSERQQKAAQIQEKVIGQCSCPASQQKQETDELNAALKVELRRCEQKGADALDQFKHSLVAQAQDDFNRYRGQIELDRQILQNFGFHQTVDEMESWTQYSEEAQKKYMREARKEVLGKFFQSIHLKAEQLAATPQMTPEKAVSLMNLFKATGIKDQALFDALRAAALKEHEIPERMLWVKVTGALEKLEKANEARELFHGEEDPVSIFNSVLDVASWMAPEAAPYVSMVQDATWIGYATYTHAEVAYGLHKVDRLTTLTEAQLKDLEPVAHRLKQDVDGLVNAKKVLQWAAESGNNTSLTR